MLYCPKCRGEFEDWAKTCPDCQLDLVAEPPPTPGQAPGFNPISELRHSIGNPRVLLVLAGTTMFLALCGLISYSVATAIGEDAGAWDVTEVSLYSLSHAIFYPGVLLGLAGVVGPSLSGSTAGAHRVFRVLVIAAIVLVLLGVGEAVTEVGRWSDSPYPDSRWYATGTVSSGLAGQIFRGGVLLGLAYLSLRRARAIDSSEVLDEEPSS